MNKIFVNKRGQAMMSKTGILFVVLIFYAVLFVFIGYINSYFSYNTDTQTRNPNDSGFFGFLDNVISGIADIPWWINTILFATLVTVIVWIIFSSLPTFNGGA